MYKIVSVLKPYQAPFDAEAFIDAQVVMLRELAVALGGFNAAFKTLGQIAPDTQSYIDGKIAEYAGSDDGLPPEVIAEFDQLAATKRVQLIDMPQVLAETLKADHSRRVTEGMTSVSLEFRTEGETGAGRLSLSMPLDGQGGALSIKMPMTHQEDFWFADPKGMRDMIAAIVTRWPVEWLVASPSVYGGPLHPNLLSQRQPFGWMGYTDQQVSETGDALSEVSPMGEGTLMVLKPSFMTLHAGDIDLCHKAEAYLADLDILPLR